MGNYWTDNPAKPSTHVRAVHINELRSGVDNLRTSPPCSLGGYPWTDNPVSTTTHIRAVHFTELRNAIQDVWNCHTMGAVPNWSVGSAPSPSRQISARDMNDLRSWVDKVDPLHALNGLHWQNPFDANSVGAREQVDQGAGFGSVLILSPQTSSPPGDQSAPSVNIAWLHAGANMKCRPGVSFNEQVIIRLYWPEKTNLIDPTTMANGWKAFIQYVQGLGGFNFQVLNEPNLEYSSPYANALWPPNPTYMSTLAQALRQTGDQIHPMYLSFPGPGGVNDPNYQFDAPNSTNWKNYWDGYRDTILTWYDDIALHCYAAPAGGVESRGVCKRLGRPVG
jgi:hypothetical protein